MTLDVPSSMITQLPKLNSGPIAGWLQRYAFQSDFELLPLTFIVSCPQVIKREGVSLSCDVFSYAIILWEIITLQKPFSDIAPSLVPYEISVNNKVSLKTV